MILPHEWFGAATKKHEVGDSQISMTMTIFVHYERGRDKSRPNS
jgi:hypothetical protein